MLGAHLLGGRLAAYVLGAHLLGGRLAAYVLGAHLLGGRLAAWRDARGKTREVVA